MHTCRTPGTKVSFGAARAAGDPQAWAGVVVGQSCEISCCSSPSRSAQDGVEDTLVPQQGETCACRGRWGPWERGLQVNLGRGYRWLGVVHGDRAVGSRWCGSVRHVPGCNDSPSVSWARNTETHATDDVMSMLCSCNGSWNWTCNEACNVSCKILVYHVIST